MNEGLIARRNMMNLRYYNIKIEVRNDFAEDNCDNEVVFYAKKVAEIELVNAFDIIRNFQRLIGKVLVCIVSDYEVENE